MQIIKREKKEIEETTLIINYIGINSNEVLTFNCTNEKGEEFLINVKDSELDKLRKFLTKHDRL